jgi:hypothetical protein
VSIEDIYEDLALELAPDPPEHLRSRTVLRGNRREVTETQLVSVAHENLLVVVPEVHRTVAAPGSAAVVRRNRQMAFGVEQPSERVCFSGAQTGGTRDTGAYLGLTAGTT